jgi:hypothetical protein
MGWNVISERGQKPDLPSISPSASRCTFSLTASTDDKPSRIALKNIDGNSARLLEEWRRDPKIPSEIEHTLQNQFRGFQVVSADGNGKIHLEGIALYATKRYGIYLRALETAPWNRIDRKIQGIASVLVARIALESGRQGYDGSVFTIPTNPMAENFNRRCGFISFRQYAVKAGLPRESYPLGYIHFVALDREGAGNLIARQLARRGNLKIDLFPKPLRVRPAGDPVC